ncbi:MAG: hypothetical protein IT260_08100 [Saprospiraceae bacterium]|nr:hypothetical protein [Saprospiraceae bacterium]
MIPHIRRLFFAPAKYIFPLLLWCSLFWNGCVPEEIDTYSGTGKRPVYLPVAALDSIGNLAPQVIQESGTIFLQDTLFFMLEQKKGIHVFSIKDSSTVASLTFFKIPAVTDFTISGNRLYADSWRDLVTIDISDLYHISLLSRQTNAFSPLLYPPLYNGFFECVDESKGAVVGWEDVFLENVRCYTVN